MPGLRNWRALCFLGQIAMMATCLCAAQSHEEPSAMATVEGVLATTELPDVTVRLERVPADPLARLDGYLATVESDGRFHFEDVAPGNYRLTADTSSRLHGEFGSSAPGIPGVVLELKAGEDRKDLTFDLFPNVVGVCGRVLDAGGKPLRADVEIYQPQFTGDGMRLRPLNGQPVVLTNPDGYFLLSNGPTADPNDRHSEIFLRANGVWYPSTESFAGATAISASAISQSGCNAIIQMPRTRCTSHRLIGSLEGKLAAPPTAYEVSLYEVNPANILFQKEMQTSIYNTGKIEFDDACDGTYAIVAWNHDSWTWTKDEPAYYASKLVHVDGKDVNVSVAGVDQQSVWNLTHQQDIWNRNAEKIPPQEPAEVSGSLALVDGLTWEKACPANISHQLTLEHDNGLQPVSDLLDKNGSFSFNKLEPGTYTLNLGMYAHGAAYVKSVLLNGQALPTLHFTLAEGEVAEMKVELSDDPAGAAGKPRAGNTEPHYLLAGAHPAASIAGHVAGPDAAGAKLTLTALRAGPSQAWKYEAVAESDGSFRLDGVTPGIYKLSTEGEHHQYSEFGANGPGLEGSAVVLSAGQQLAGLDLKTYAKTAICGRVIDSDGRPRAGIEVWLRGSTGIPNANGSLGSWTKHTVTDSNGKYMIADAGPGYRDLWAKNGDMITYFPSYTGENRFYRRLELKSEQQGCVFDIYLRSADGTSAMAHRVMGTVEGSLDSSLGDRFYINLEPADKVFTPAVDRVQITTAGSFVLKGVWPRKYTLTVEGEYGNGFVPCGIPSSICGGYFHHLLASQQLTVADRDVENIRLSIGALPTLDGEIVVDGELPQGWTSRHLTLFWGNESKSVEADVGGHFAFPSLDALRYGFSITGYPPENAYEPVDLGPNYIVSAALDGKPVVGRHIELHVGQKAHLVIHIKAGATSGKLVVLPTGPPVDPYIDPCRSLGQGGTAVLMIPDPLPEDNSGIIGVGTQPGGSGEGYVRSAPPGHYRVVAVDNVEIPMVQGIIAPRTMAPAPHDFFVKLAAMGKPVEVVAGQEFEFTVPLLTEQAQQLMAEMGLGVTHW